MTDEERWRFETGGLLKAGETQEQAIIRWKGGPRTLDKIRDKIRGEKTENKNPARIEPGNRSQGTRG